MILFFRFGYVEYHVVVSSSVEKYGMITDGSFNPIEILVAIKTFITVFIGALSIGCAVGVTTAIVTKYTYLRDYPLLETSLFFLMSYCSFLIAEVASLSGMICLFNILLLLLL